jgi:integrase
MKAAGRLADNWPVRDSDPFASPDLLPAGTDPGSVSRFGDSRWNLSPLSSHSHATAVTVNWQLVEDPVLRGSVRRAGWALVNLPVPDEILDRSATRRTRWPSTATIAGHLTQLRRFANWLARAGIGSLAEVTTADLERYAAHLSQRGSVRAATDGLYALIRLWGAAPHLLPHDRLPMPPWEASDLSDYLPEAVRANENATAPIHPAVMSPLLIWSLRFADDFADDIITAWHEHQRLAAQIPQADAPDGRQKIHRFVRQQINEGRPLPGRPHGGGVHRADTYIAAMLHVSPRQVKNTLNRHTEAKDAGLSPHARLDTVVTGRLHGQPWKPFIDFHEAPAMMRLLSAACMITIGYLSGMRPGEVLSLKVGCCPEPDPDSTAPARYAIYGNVLKGIRDEEGRCIPDGKPRDLPWTVIPPVVHAIRVLERIADGDDLFPVVTAWNNQTAHNAARKRTGHLLTAAGARDRIRSFIGHANQLAAQHDLDWERIPDDPDGPVALSRMRRTIAWHIARLPGGRIALALQYGHLRASTVTEGYSGRARHGLRRVLDIETARAMADYLDGLAERVSHGEGISGPAAPRMIAAARASATRFQGMFLSPKMADAWLDDSRLTVYDNPDAFLTCNHDPSKALCRPGRTSRKMPPAIERCDPACANIARTDTHISRLREEVAQLEEEIASPLTPTPLRERLKQRTVFLHAIADRHQRTRLASPLNPGTGRHGE